MWKFWSLVAMLSMFFLSIPLVASAPLSDITLDIPATDAVITGTSYCVNATTTGDTASNVTFWYRIGSSGDFTPFVENETANSGNTIFGNCIDTTAVLGGDSGTYEINVTAFENNTNTNFVSATNTMIFVDNAAPIVIFELSTLQTQRLSAKGIIANCGKSSDALDGTLDYLQTITKPSRNTKTSTSASYNIANGDVEELGIYTITCRVTDFASLSSTSSSVSFRVVNDDDGAVVPGVVVTSAKQSSFGLMFIIIPIVVIIVVILMLTLYTTMSKK